ncbi:hypothetical protein [Mesorhizobium sp. RIZ17]|uniref:hypothetical protein n=1 Tax=Mesorhizobium sp. RIZ17 TaxID=3132743 RepID=UPI003DA9CCA1
MRESASGCNLGVALPNEPFPNLNDRASIKKIIREMIIGSYLMLALRRGRRAGGRRAVVVAGVAPAALDGRQAPARRMAGLSLH